MVEAISLLQRERVIGLDRVEVVIWAGTAGQPGFGPGEPVMVGTTSMTILKMLLWCAFVGAKRNAFSVEIDAREYVIDLKRAIKKLKEAALKDTDPDELELYLALTHDGKSWLRTDEFDVAQLTNGIVTAVVRDIQCGDNRLVEDDTIEEVFKGKPALGRKQLHLLIVVPKSSLPVAVTPRSMWLVTGTITYTRVTRGVRSRIYRLAAFNAGCFDPAHLRGGKSTAIWYEGDKTLRIHILFEKKKESFYFHNNLVEEALAHASPLYNHVVQLSATQVGAPPGDLLNIYGSDYVAGETDSPPTTSAASTGTLIVDLDTDVFKYQRLEHEDNFGGMMKPDSCRVMAKEQCLQHASDPNNRLALSVIMRAWYDGRNLPVPTMNISVESVADRPDEAMRYTVHLIIHAWNHVFAQLILDRMKEGTEVLDNRLQMRTHVQVENPKIFCECVAWKFRQIEEAWQEYSDMALAVE